MKKWNSLSTGGGWQHPAEWQTEGLAGWGSIRSGESGAPVGPEPHLSAVGLGAVSGPRAAVLEYREQPTFHGIRVLLLFN